MTIGRLIEGRDAAILTCEASMRVREAVATLAERRIGAMPVLENGTVTGIFSERDVIYRLHDEGPTLLDRTVGEVMERPLPTIDVRASLDDAFLALSEGAPALVAVRAGRPAGVVTKLDLLEYLAHRGGSTEG